MNWASLSLKSDMRQPFTKGCFASAVEGFPQDELMAVISVGIGVPLNEDMPSIDESLGETEACFCIQNPSPAFLTLFPDKVVRAADQCCTVALSELVDAQKRLLTDYSSPLYRFIDTCINYLGVEMAQDMAFGKFNH